MRIFCEDFTKRVSGESSAHEATEKGQQAGSMQAGVLR